MCCRSTPHFLPSQATSGFTADSSNDFNKACVVALKISNKTNHQFPCQSGFKCSSLNNYTASRSCAKKIDFPSLLNLPTKHLDEFQLPLSFHRDKMCKKLFVNLLLLLSAVQIYCADNNSKIVCYYDSRAFGREGKCWVVKAALKFSAITFNVLIRERLV